MNKNLLSIAIIAVAVAIVVVNFWDSSSDAENNLESADMAVDTDAATSDDIPGIDLTDELEGNMAPDFELTTLAGEKVKLSDYQGKKVILNFWATWCPPCRAEMPHMQNFYEKHKDGDIEILAVNLTNMDKGRTNIEDFVDEFGLTFPIPLDEDGSIGTQYQAYAIPTSYIIDTNGVIANKIIGPMDESMMENLVNDID